MSIVKEQISFKSSDGKSICKGDIYKPKHVPIKYVLQIAHGMAEHFGRYEELARQLAERGYVVVGIDHIGHGRSVSSIDELGVFDRKNGANHIVDDQFKLHKLVSQTFGEVPYFLLGHSMGSFVVRNYIEKYADSIDGAIIMGTGYQSKLSLYGGRLLTGAISIFHGWDYRSKLVDSAGCGSYNDEFEGTGAQTGYEWLSKNEENCIAYAQDELCGWLFSISGYYMISDLLLRAQNKKLLQNVPNDFPILIISGKDDPVGCFGDGPVRVFKDLRAAEVEDLALDIVENARHELLNENNKQETIENICVWIQERAYK